MKNKKREKEYYTKAEFVTLSKKSVKTVERLAAKLIANNPTTKKVKKEKRVLWLHHSLLKKYVSEYHLQLEGRLKSLENTIDSVRDQKRMGTTLWWMEWSFYGGLNFKNRKEKKQCYNTMQTILKELKEKFTSTKIRMFFATEDAFGEGNNHCHFTLYVSDSALHDEVLRTFKELTKGDRLYITEYDHYLAGVYYNVKEGLKGDTWDILGD